MKCEFLDCGILYPAYYSCECGNVFGSDICFDGAICPKCGKRTNHVSPGEWLPDLSVRSYNIMKRAGIRSGMEELLCISDEDLLQMYGMTQSSFDELSRYRKYFYDLQATTGLDRKDRRSITEYLKPDFELIPKWLSVLEADDPVDLQEALSSSRIVYHPDSMVDTKLIKPFITAEYAHLFLYADPSFNRECYLQKIKAEGFEGYHILQSSPFRINALISKDRKFHEEPLKTKKKGMDQNEALGEITVFERTAKGETIGCERFALIHLCADGAVIYDALFGNHKYELDTLFLKGFRYKNGYLIHRIAYQAKAYPKYLMSAYNAGWFGYPMFCDLNTVVGKKPNERYYLFMRNDMV